MDPDHLAGQFFRLLADGGLSFGSATIRFDLDPSLLGSAVGGIPSLDVFHVVRGGVLSIHPAVHDGGDTLRADGVEAFSDWYPATGDLSVGDWGALVD